MKLIINNNCTQTLKAVVFTG